MLGVICGILEWDLALCSGTDHGDADIASSSGCPAEDEDEVLAERLGYEYSFGNPEEASPFL